MPCYRCGARQTDPVRGPSPWRRGVRAQQQVLVCPACQRDGAWTAELDACSRCGSTALARVLGETVCRACGADRVSAVPPAAHAGDGPPGDGTREALASEVAAALDRLFARGSPVDR